MKVICDRAALLEAVNLVAGVVSGRTPTPVERRFVASSITGAGRMYVRSNASLSIVRPLAGSPGGTSNETL